jgi:hypothetical protein
MSRAGVEAGLEVAVGLSYLLYCIWVVDPSTAGAGVPWPYYAVFLGFTILTHLRHGDRAADLGLRLDTLGRALLEGVAVVGPGLLIAFAIGRSMEGGRPMNLQSLALSWVGVYPWALFQQYGLQCLFGRRLEGVVRHPVGHDALCAAIFAALHLPNPFLAMVTLGAGYCFCALFRRCPNLFALGAVHALASSILYHCLPAAVTHLMRVGPGYLSEMRLP